LINAGLPILKENGENSKMQGRTISAAKARGTQKKGEATFKNYLPESESAIFANDCDHVLYDKVACPFILYPFILYPAIGSDLEKTKNIFLDTQWSNK
jgi:hypothetical protein